MSPERTNGAGRNGDPDRDFPDAPRADYGPTGVERKTTFFATLKRTFKEFSEDNMTDWAASLTYYGLLSLFPAMIALVSLVGLFADPAKATQTITDIISKLSPGTDTSAFAGPIKSVTSHKSASGILFVVGLATALWSASAYIGAFMRASNVVWETPEGRGFFKLRPLQLLVTLIMIVLFAAVVLALILTGPVVDSVAGPLGLGSTAVTIWN